GHLIKGGVRVARVEPHAAGGAGAGELLGAGQLRGDGRDGDGVGVGEGFVELRFARRPKRFRWVTAARIGSEVGAVEMRAQHAGAGLSFFTPLPPKRGERGGKCNRCTTSRTR